MNFNDALHIAYPLRSWAASWSEGEAIESLVSEMIEDQQWLNSLESEYASSLDDAKNAVRDAILQGGDIKAACAELKAAYRIAAHKLATSELRKEAEADAVLAWELRQGDCE